MKKTTITNINKVKDVASKTGLVVGLVGATLSLVCGFAKPDEPEVTKGGKKNGKN